MPTFEIKGKFITAPTKEIAIGISIAIEECATLDKKYILIRDRGNNAMNFIDMENTSGLEVYTIDGKTINYCGSMISGLSSKLIQSAVDSINGSDQIERKIAFMKRMEKHREFHEQDKKFIAKYESTIPEQFKKMYGDIMFMLEGNTDAHRIEIFEKVAEAGVEVTEKHWPSILIWFNDILKKESEKPFNMRSDFHSLRKGFGTAIVRMVKEDVRNASPLKNAKDESRDPDYWTKYAQDKR